MPDHTSLTSLTLKGALDGLASKAFTAEEVARAHIDAIESRQSAPQRLCPSDPRQGHRDGPRFR